MKQPLILPDEWMEDLPRAVDELMSHPLSVSHPLAFSAPEVIRENALRVCVEAKLADNEV